MVQRPVSSRHYRAARRVSGGCRRNAYRLLAYEWHCKAAYATKYKAVSDVFAFAFSGGLADRPLDLPAKSSGHAGARRLPRPYRYFRPAPAHRRTHRRAPRRFTAAETVAYGIADEEIGGPARAPESGTPA
jgi:hypothetical protein